MIFSSPPFFLFFSIYLLLHLAVPVRYRLALIIAGSTFFYGYWNPWYVWLPYLLVAIAFLGAIWLEKARGTSAHAKRIVAVVTLLLVPLAIIKYTNFVYQDVLGLFLGPMPKLVTWAFPLGISFITFTMIAYVVDVYRGKYPLENRAGLLTGLVLFFPHLIAGPILRPADLIPQLANPASAWRAFSIRFVYGLAIFTLGLFKKLVLADSLGGVVQAMYEGGGRGLTGAEYLLADYAFCVQIYCDFSGYTDMAIGTAIILGVHLPTNFRQPYAAASVAEYWRRWHITLSNWLRDYVYIPLGGNRGGEASQFRNIVITLGIGGLWHGAHWTFVIWGLLHGMAIGCNHLISRHMPQTRFKMPHWFKVLLTFHFILTAFIMFRSPDFATMWRIMAGPFNVPWGSFGSFLSGRAFELILLVLFFATHRFDSYRTVRGLVHLASPVVYWPVIGLIWVLSIAISQDYNLKFIYFDF